jgi:hypothetical protein
MLPLAVLEELVPPERSRSAGLEPMLVPPALAPGPGPGLGPRGREPETVPAPEPDPGGPADDADSREYVAEDGRRGSAAAAAAAATAAVETSNDETAAAAAAAAVAESCAECVDDVVRVSCG